MCKTNHSLSFQICHELPDQREMRKATFQTGPQGSLNQTSLSGAGKDRSPQSALVPQSTCRTRHLCPHHQGGEAQIQSFLPVRTVGNNITDKPRTPRRHLLPVTRKQINWKYLAGESLRQTRLNLWPHGWSAFHIRIRAIGFLIFGSQSHHTIMRG